MITKNDDCDCHFHQWQRERAIPGTVPTSTDTPALKKAARELDTAVGAELEARTTWSEAAAAASRFEATLRHRYKDTMRGIEAATPTESAQLRQLADKAAELFQRYQATARITVEKRQLHTAEQQKAIQSTIEAWAGATA